MTKFHFGIIISLLILVSGCAQPVDLYIPAKEPAPLKLAKRPHVTLVLGGGSARGYAHVGVLKVLAAAHIPIDLIVATSAGGLVGALYADNANAAYVESTMRKTKFFDFADFTVITNGKGFISGRQLQHFLMSHMRSRWFNELKIPLVVVATDLYSGQPKILSSGPIPPAIHATAAMPGVVHPVTLYGHQYIDGGIVAQLPVNIAKQYHSDIIIAVNLQCELSPELPTSFAGVLNRAFDISIRTVENYSGQGADVVIHPALGATGLFEIEKKMQLIRAGEIAAQKALPEIKAILRKKQKQ